MFCCGISVKMCFGTAGMDRAGALRHPEREGLGVLSESFRVAKAGALWQLSQVRLGVRLDKVTITLM